jgi:preprotein translocase subunit SecF
MIRYRKISYFISGSLVLLSIVAFVVWGLKPAIDFTGGALLEVEYQGQRPDADQGQRPDAEDVRVRVSALGLGNILVQPIGEQGMLLRLRDITEQEHQILLQALVDEESSLVEKRFDSIGPIIGKELTQKAWKAILAVIAMIILFIAWAFRKVSKPVSSWKYGLVAIAALVHDIVVPVGVFSVLGHFWHVEVDVLFVTALLTILGFSIHDTIVVFDRVRENLKRGVGSNFEDEVSISLRQVRGRSVKTSLAILLVLIALFAFGGATTKYFSLTLVLGIILGTYSSLFLASPLLVTWHKWQERER